MCVSVIIPTYNAAKFIGETLASVLAQTWRDWELILIDDGSTDDTLRILNEFASKNNHVKVVAVANGGESAARNTGFTHSDPNRKYVIFLDHDDVWLPHALATLIGGFEHNPGAIAIHAVGTMVDDKTQRILPGELEAWCRRRKKWIDGIAVDCLPRDPTVLFTMGYHICVATMGVCLFNRTALPTPPFWTQLRSGGADYHLYLQLLRNGTFAFIDDVIILKRQHAHNTTNDQDASLKGLYTGMLAVWRMEDTNILDKKILEKSYEFRTREDARAEFRCGVNALKRLKLTAMIYHLRNARRYFKRRTLPLAASVYGVDAG